MRFEGTKLGFLVTGNARKMELRLKENCLQSFMRFTMMGLPLNILLFIAPIEDGVAVSSVFSKPYIVVEVNQKFKILIMIIEH